MIVESGLIVFAGLMFIFMKLPPRLVLRLLGRPLILDLAISAVVYSLHWGTYTGVMAAAFAGMMTSVFTTLARRYYGFVVHQRYFPGIKQYPPDLLK